jgi:hypothetical protein
LPGGGIIENHEITEADWKSIGASLRMPIEARDERPSVVLGLGFAAVAQFGRSEDYPVALDGDMRVPLDSGQHFGVISLERVERGGASWLTAKLDADDRAACHAWSQSLVGREVVVYSGERVLCRVHLDQPFSGDAILLPLRDAAAIQRVGELRDAMADDWGL